MQGVPLSDEWFSMLIRAAGVRVGGLRHEGVRSCSDVRVAARGGVSRLLNVVLFSVQRTCRQYS